MSEWTDRLKADAMTNAIGITFEVAPAIMRRVFQMSPELILEIEFAAMALARFENEDADHPIDWEKQLHNWESVCSTLALRIRNKVFRGMPCDYDAVIREWLK